MWNLAREETAWSSPLQEAGSRAFEGCRGHKQVERVTSSQHAAEPWGLRAAGWHSQGTALDSSPSTTPGLGECFQSVHSLPSRDQIALSLALCLSHGHLASYPGTCQPCDSGAVVGIGEGGGWGEASLLPIDESCSLSLVGCRTDWNQAVGQHVGDSGGLRQLCGLEIEAGPWDAGPGLPSRLFSSEGAPPTHRGLPCPRPVPPRPSRRLPGIQWSGGKTRPNVPRGEGRRDPLPRPGGPLPSLRSPPFGEEEGHGGADGGFPAGAGEPSSPLSSPRALRPLLKSLPGVRGETGPLAS